MAINKYVGKVGCEIEGAWMNIKGCRGVEAINSLGIVHDGSVKFDGKFPKRMWEMCKAEGKYSNPSQSMQVGEVVSAPFDSVEKAVQWMLKFWPDMTNSSCGLHFHISVNDPAYYSCLMEKEFYLFMKESLGKFADEQKLNRIFRERFAGTTAWAKKYCRDEFIPLKQAFVTQKQYNDANRSRYTMLNFCHGLHETMEIRVFTAHMPSKRATNCLLWYIDVVTSFLEQNFDKLSNTPLTKEDLVIEAETEDIAFVKMDLEDGDIITDEFSLEAELAV